MDDIIGCIVELLLDGIIEIIQEPRIPKWIRGIVLILVTILYLAFAALFVWLAVQVPAVWVKCLLIAVAFLFLGLMARMWYRLIKEK